MREKKCKDEGETMSRLMKLAILFSCFVAFIWAAESAQSEVTGLIVESTHWEDWTVYGLEEGLEHESDEVGLIIHHVGDRTKPVIYSFYVIPDLHVGDCAITTQEDANDPWADYNLEGYEPNLDLRPAVQEEGVWRPAGIPDYDGTRPGKNANRIINLINDDYDFGQGNGRFCVVIGDMSVRAEVAEQQHARMKLDSLDCPWVPVMGNHDTWPWA